MKMLGTLGIVALLAMGPACSKDKGGSKAEDTNASRPSEAQHKKRAANLVAPPMFKRIPADSPYVFANYEPWDADFVKAMGKMMEPIMEVATSKIQQDEDPEAAAFMKEYGEIFSIAGLEKIGIDTSPHFAMYINGPSFVVRVELANGDALFSFAEGLIKKYGDEPVETKTMGTMRYWESPPDTVAMVAGIDKKEAVFAIFPSSQKDRLLPSILGDAMPAKSIVDTGSLKEVVAKYGGATGLGYVDSKALLAMLTDGKEGIAGSELDLSSMSSVCKSEFGELAALAPKMVFGYEDLSTKKIGMFWGVELRKDVAKKLGEVLEPVPGYDFAKKSKAMMSFGMGASVGGLMSWATELAAKVQASPYQCPDLAPLNEGYASIANGASIVPPVVNDLGGFIAIVDGLNPANPMSMRGMIAVQSKEPGPLLSLISGFVPGLSSLKLEQGAAPKKLDLGGLGVPLDLYAARGKTMLGVAAGDSKKELKALVASKKTEDGPFMLMNFDYSSLAGLMPKTEGTGAAEAALMEKMFKALGLLSFEARTTSSGIAGRYVLTLN